MRRRNVFMLLARGLCALIAAAATLVFVAALPAYFRRFQTLAHIGRADFQQMALDNLANLGLSTTFYAGYYVFLGVFFAVVCLFLAGLILGRQRREPMALYTAMLLVFLGTGFTNPVTAWESTHPLATWLKSVLGALSVATIILFFFVFPDGRFAPRRLRWPILILVGYLVLAAVLTFPGMLSPENWPAAFYSLFLLVCILIGVLSQIYRYRRLSDASERRQARFVVFGFVLALLISTGVVVVQILAPDVEPGTVAELTATTLALLGMLLIPLAIAGAILRYNLFDIDLIIRLTLVYSVLSLILATVFYGAIILTQFLFRTVLRAAAPMELVTVLSTLTIAAMFAPLRRRIQTLIDRRFYRPRYDARQTLSDFARLARDEVDLEELAHGLLQTIVDTMQPAHIRLWLHDNVQLSSEGTGEVQMVAPEGRGRSRAG